MNSELDLQNLAANVGPADLMAVLSKYPKFFTTLLVVFIIFCIGYGIFWFARKKKSKNSEEKQNSQNSAE